MILHQGTGSRPDPITESIPLSAKGAWALRSDDDGFSTNGWFESADTVAPLTF